MIGCFNCPIICVRLQPIVRLHVSDYSQLSNYNYTEWLMKNKAANAPITFEEIVMVMINTNIGRSVHTQIKRNDKTKSVLDISQAKHQYRFSC